MPQGLASERAGLRGAGPSRNSVDHITWVAGGTLVFGAIAYYSSSQQSELTSELLCWALLPVVFGIAKRRRNTDKPGEALLPSANRPAESRENGKPSAISLWTIAISIAICSVFRAERGIVLLFPALVPLLNLGHIYLRPSLHPPTGYHMSFFPLITHNITGSILAAIFTIVALAEWEPVAHGLSAAPVVALFIAYTLLTPQACQRSRWLQSIDIEAAAWPLSLRIVVLVAIVLGIESYTIGFPSPNALETLTLGSGKALMWYFTSQLAKNSSWLVAAVAGNFSLMATRDPYNQQTDIRALMTVVASLISLGQIVFLLPKQAKAKLTLWILAAIPVLPYLSDLAAIQFAKSSAVVHTERHPVEILIREAIANFDALLGNQSSTYSGAYAEYQRRYGFEPPDGFEDWYNFARSHQSPIIDEFDMISNGVAPFLQVSGQEVLEIISQVNDQPDHELWSCSMSGQPAKTECSHHRRDYDRGNGEFFNKMTEQIPAALNLKFLLNHLDEPTVIIPPSSQQETNPVFTNYQGKRAWEAVTKFCSSRKRRTDIEQKPPIETYGLPFVTDRKSAMDVCEHAEYSETHGIFTSPTSLLLVEAPVPVLSNGAPSVFGDLLYPSSAYLEEDRFSYHDNHDVDWDKKQNNLYWAGSTTGGANHPEQWRNLHRHRFVELAQNLKRRVFSYLREKNGVIGRVASSFLNGRLYDVAFTNVLQCDTKACQEQRQYFRIKTWASGDRPFHSRLVFDLDGNGISGRYYKLLASKSLPLKQTLIREWHDERLMPWIHFIPVSQSMEELPELVFYLTSTESGQRRAREIAERGRQWYKQAFRDVDVVIYMYRLFLELARLEDPDRPAWKIEVG
ncbi:hypothetical protein F5Y09DRAFT_331184 [Xylaria sp. FL1042]|nr:hypothetical protein F5Y09DRAFT_331184 [Xylaria sp. FL1042]